MIDLELLREDFAGTKNKLVTRTIPEDLDSFPNLDSRRKEIIVELESIRANKNSLGPEIAKAKKEGRDVSALLSSLKNSGDREKELAAALSEIEAQFEDLQLRIPNLPDQSVPQGKSSEENVVVKEWGTKPTFSFSAKAHWEIGEALGILDFESAALLSGARFSLYRGDGARLERALIAFMLDQHRQNGYEEIIPPFLVTADTMTGSGQLPKFEADLFKTNSTERTLYLIPTAEVPLCNMHREKILEEDLLPIYYTSYTPCFRGEAGSYGRDVRGLIRLHQFQKVELVKITNQETSWDEHEKMTRNAEGILEALGLAYRRVLLCTGDMGFCAAKTYDLEVWLPGQNGGEYREISSCSNTCDFQGRRTKTRYRPKAGGKPKFVHMLNGSGLAVGRTFLAILENYQQADGSVVIPEVLRPYLGGQERIAPAL